MNALSGPARSLIELAGPVMLYSTVPSRRARPWRDFASALRAALFPLGVSLNLGSWRSLWVILHHDSRNVPRSVSWGHLLGTCMISHLADLVKACPGHSEFNICSWNVRWLVSSFTPHSCSKAAIVNRLVLRGHPTALVEKNWFHDACAVAAPA